MAESYGCRRLAHPTDGNTGGGVPNATPIAGLVEVCPLDAPRGYKSPLKSKRRAICDVRLRPTPPFKPGRRGP